MQGLNLNQSQTQQQKLSYQMIQSINLLADNSEVLRDKILAEVEKNPALEIVEKSSVHTLNRKPKNFGENSFESIKHSSSEKSDAFQSFLESSPDSETLQEHLLRQLNFLRLTEQENRIGQMIIQNLDKNGYHIIALESLFPGEEMQIANKVLKLIHEFEPVGVACRDLKESLFIQAYENDADDFTLNFIKNHFELLNNPKPQIIQKKLLEEGENATVDEIEQIISFIRSLEPFPAREYESMQTVFISPDVKITKSEDEEDEFFVDLVKANLPVIRINKEFQDFQNSNEQMKKAFDDASKFITAIEMRNATLQKVATQILIEQKEFFKKGPLALKPLRMKDVAEKIGVHETTVSRIANDKYLRCDWGLFEFKYFFSNAVKVSSSNKSDEVLSKEAIKQVLAKIIEENEKNGSKQLSDQKLTDKLAEKGIKIARRTVAKYRTELNVNSSYDR